MKMKQLKIAVLALATAFGIAGNASAALQGASSGNSAYIFSAWDSTTGRSYTRALGMNLNNFLPAQGTTASFNFAPDANFQSMFGSSISSGTFLWNVAAGDNTTTTGERFAITTASQSIAPLLGAPYNAGVSLNTYLGQVSNACAIGPNTGSCTSTQATDAWSVLNSNSTKWGINAGGALNFSDVGAIGQSLYFAFLSAPPGTTGGRGNATVGWYGNNAPYQWTLASDGTLTYNAAVAAVPVPAAVWLLGSGLFGLVGVGRRREKDAAKDVVAA